MTTKSTSQRVARGALRVQRRDDQVAVLWIDVPGRKVNVVTRELVDELQRVLGELEQDSSVRGIVIASVKKGFLAGADVQMLKACGTAEQGTALARRAQRLTGRIAELPKPVVAAVHGDCLGGGLELAMACDARVLADARDTRLGQPEVQLGLLPGAGGTQRLPRLVGLEKAVTMMVSGKQLMAGEALRAGLADELVPKPILVDVAAQHVTALAEDSGETANGGTERLRRWLDPQQLEHWVLAETPLGRRIFFDQSRKRTRARTHGNYEAPEHILDVVRVGLEQGFEEGLKAEADAFGRLLAGSQAGELIFLFEATQQLKKDPGLDGEAAEPRETPQVGVLGGGLMGSGIAYVTAEKAGRRVRLKDKDDDGVLGGLHAIRRSVDAQVKRGRRTPVEGDVLMHRVGGTIDYRGFQHCPAVIEAVFEDLDLKQRMLREVEAAGPDDVIFASNTSALPIGRIAEASRHPETVVGMHYFSPVERMPLLEVVAGEQTAPWVVRTCVELGKQQGKTVIVVRDGVGFYTTRILAAFLNEAFHMLAEGVPVETIDQAVTQFGFPVGPIKLTDEVGIDVAAEISQVMSDAFGERMQPAPGMGRLLADDRRGSKNGRGFYLHDGRKGEVDVSVYDVLGIRPDATRGADEDIAWRCTLKMVNEAARCLEEGIVRSPRDADVGAVLGLGFPPFRGGPFRFVDSIGPRVIVERLRHYRDSHGVRFEAAAELQRAAERGSRYYPPRASAQPEPVVSSARATA